MKSRLAVLSIKHGHGHWYQASEALQQAGDAAWLKQPALVATQAAFLEALDDVTTARKLLEEAIAAQQSGKPAKAQPSSETVSAEAFLYQSLAKLQLKVIILLESRIN